MYLTLIAIFFIKKTINYTHFEILFDVNSPDKEMVLNTNKYITSF